MNLQNKFSMGFNSLSLCVFAIGLLVACGGGGGGGTTADTGGGAGGGGGSTLPAIWLAATGPSGIELYGSDGTATGTTLIKDINPSGNSSPGGVMSSGKANSIMFNGFLYFPANDGVSGIELWKSDGTQSGTTMVKDIYVGSLSSNPSEFTIMGNTLYFVATNSTNGTELWKTDGTEAGTVLVSDIVAGPGSSGPGMLVVMGNNLYFAASNLTYGYELWKTDGTDVGTVLVKDIYAGASGSNLISLITMGNNLYFSAYHPSYGWELWKSDGTTAGTSLLIDLTPGSNASGAYSSNPYYLTVKGNEFYFTANNVLQTGGIVVFNGTQLWKSDGTAVGTVKLKDLAPPATGGGSFPSNLTVVGTQLFFTAYYSVTTTVNNVTTTTSYGTELWKSDGTVAGTVMVKDINTGAGDGISSLPNITAVGSTAYFVASNGTTGYELWKSDGTNAGTVLVKDINPGTANSNPGSGTANQYTRRSFTVVGNNIYFIANDGSNTSGLWKSDGTDTGTVNIINMNTTPATSVNLLMQ